MIKKVIWTKIASAQFQTAIKYIRLNSDQNADKVKEKILNKINGLSKTKIVYRKDPYKKIMMAIIYILNLSVIA